MEPRTIFASICSCIAYMSFGINEDVLKNLLVIQNAKLKKYNALILSDEMAEKQNDLNAHEKKWLK